MLAIALAIFCFVKRRDANPLAAALPVAALAGWMAAQKMDSQTDAALLFNGYALALGIVTLVRGVRRERIASANAGMAVIAFPNPHYPPDEDALALAAARVDALPEITPELVERLR